MADWDKAILDSNIVLCRKKLNSNHWSKLIQRFYIHLKGTVVAQLSQAHRVAPPLFPMSCILSAQTHWPEFTKLGLRKPWFKTRQNASYDIIFLVHGLNFNTGLYVRQWTTHTVDIVNLLREFGPKRPLVNKTIKYKRVTARIFHFYIGKSEMSSHKQKRNFYN